LIFANKNQISVLKLTHIIMKV